MMAVKQTSAITVPTIAGNAPTLLHVVFASLATFHTRTSATKPANLDSTSALLICRAMTAPTESKVANAQLANSTKLRRILAHDDR